MESNIHFPTDLNLLWDSVRKSIETVGYFRKQNMSLTSWREWKDWRKKVKSSYRCASETHRKKGANYEQRLSESVSSYIELCKKISLKVEIAISEIALAQAVMHKLSKTDENKLKELLWYYEMLEKHIDLVNRRILLGETIPHSEKVFSIFEQHVEWNSKGKAGASVEFGHNVLVGFDQYRFALHGEVYEKTVDKSRTIEIGNTLHKKYGNGEKIYSISFDKNFFSYPAEKGLEEQYKIFVLPKAGRKSKHEFEQIGNEEYEQVKKAHSKVEGNINELEQHGLGICRDKGIDGFKRVVAYGILSHNLTNLGRLVIAADLKKIKRVKKQKIRQVA